MATGRRTRSLWYLAPLALVALLIVAIVLILQPPIPREYGAVRAFGLLGYLGIAFGVASSLYMVEMARFFGRPFVRLHHIITYTSLALITLHPLTYAAAFDGLKVFVPTLGSWSLFWTNAGRPALYLLALAALAAILRGRLGRWWRNVHWLNYAAFLMGTVHALRSGTDTRYLAMRILAVSLSVFVAGAFVAKRLPTRRRGQARPRTGQPAGR